MPNLAASAAAVQNSFPLIFPGCYSLRVRNHPTTYIYSGTKVIAEYPSGASAESPAVEYVYSGSQLMASIAGGTTTYYLFDHLSPRVLTDSNGVVIGQQGHYPYGETWYAQGATTKWQYTGYERDPETGADYAVFRHYLNRYGRFATPDPYHPSADPYSPQSLNRYNYVTNDAVNFIDPLGLQEGSPQAPIPALMNWINIGGTVAALSSLSIDVLGGIGDPFGLLGFGVRMHAPMLDASNGKPEGGAKDASNCVSPSKVQSFVIPHVALPAAQYRNKTVVWGLGSSGGAGFGKAVGVVGSLSVQIAVSPNGNAAYLITYSAPSAVAGPLGTYPAVTPSTKGLSILGGSQFGFSNATDPSQLGGTSIDASGSLAAGIGIGGDASLGADGIYQATVTLGFGAGGRGTAGALTNTTVVPICRTW